MDAAKAARDRQKLPYMGRAGRGLPPPRRKSPFMALLIFFVPLAGAALSLIAAYVAISPQFLRFLVGGGKGAQELLEGYRNWLASIMGALAIGVALAATVIRLCTFRVPGSLLMTGISFALSVIICGAMVIVEDVPSLYARATADIGQAKSGELGQVIVWLSPKARKMRLPGPYTKGQPEPVTRYGGISLETGGKWVDFFFPDGLGFSLDEEALYQEERSIEWNEMHARKYLIRYTEGLRVVVSAEPLGNAAAARQGSEE